MRLLSKLRTLIFGPNCPVSEASACVGQPIESVNSQLPGPGSEQIQVCASEENDRFRVFAHLPIKEPYSERLKDLFKD